MYDDGVCHRCDSYDCRADCFEFGSARYLALVEACRDRSQRRAEDAEERERVAVIKIATLEIAAGKLRREAEAGRRARAAVAALEEAAERLLALGEVEGDTATYARGLADAAADVLARMSSEEAL